MILIRYILLFIGVHIGFCACNNNNKTSKEDIDVVESTTKDSISSEIEEVALSFHKWYISAINSCDSTIHFSPSIVEDENGMCKVDYDPYFDQLRKLGTISDKFLESERKSMSECENYINTIHYQTYINADAYVFDTHCINFYYYVWVRSQESPDGIIAIKTVIDENNTSAQVDAAFTYNGANISPKADLRIFLEKENENKWKIVKMYFFSQSGELESDVSDKDYIEPENTDSIFGNWENQHTIRLDVYREGINVVYHGQCVYFYKAEVISDKEVILIWDYNMDCKFDNYVHETFGLENHPEVGKPFAKYILEADMIYVEYFYKEWVEAYSKNVNNEVFTQTFFRRNDY